MRMMNHGTGLSPGGGRAGQEGAAIVVILALAVPMLIVSGTMLGVVVSSHSELEMEVVEANARSVVASGMHQVLAQVSSANVRAGTYTFEIDGAIVEVEVDDWSSDGIDNDGDGSVDTGDEERLLNVHCTGWVNGEVDAEGRVRPSSTGRSARSTCEVLLLRNQVDLEIPAAVYLDDPLSNVKISGNAFYISGFDTNLDGSEGSGDDIPGIGIAGDPASVIAGISMSQVDNIVGKGGEPSIEEVLGVDLEESMKALAAGADVRFFDEWGEMTGSVGSIDEPVVVHARRNLKIHGNTKGAGVLVIEGDLDMVGNFDWSGLIICGGSVRASGGGQVKDVRGALLCLGELSAWIWGTTDSDDSDPIDATINGGVTIQYSSEGLAVAEEVMSSGYSILTWVEESDTRISQRIEKWLERKERGTFLEADASLDGTVSQDALYTEPVYEGSSQTFTWDQTTSTQDSLK